MGIKNVNIDNVSRGLIVGEEELKSGNSVINQILGCTDSAACNYNENATEDDSSCSYPNATCLGLSEADYGYSALASGQECNLTPLDVCPGCYIDGNPTFPKNSQTVAGKSFEWCEFCGDPDAQNYNADSTNDASKVSWRNDDMCLYTACINPETGLSCCNQFFPTLGEADNYTHDESKCVYAHPGCQCSGTSAVTQSGYCGDCMASQPNDSSVVLTTGVAEGYCDCDGNTTDGYCDCNGSPTTSNCECGTNTIIDNNYCDCSGVNAKSPVCGCDGSATGTTLPTYSTKNVLDSNGVTQQVYQNNDYCDCNGTLPTAYYYDNNGDGYGHASYGLIYVCSHHLPSGSSLTLSSPVTGVQGGWSVNQSPCLDDQKDCNGKCPSEFQALYGETYGAALNSCNQCVAPAAQAHGWEENCCAADVNTDCSICNDDFNEGQVGALSYSETEDGEYHKIIYRTNIATNFGYIEDTFYTCDCSNLVGKNYYSDNLELEIKTFDDCNTCTETKNAFVTTSLPKHLEGSGGEAGVALTKQSEYALNYPDASVYCDCASAAANTPIAIDQCCGNKIKACDGKCYDPEDSNAPQLDCNNDCGGNKVQTNCCGCVNITVLENEDCNRECCGIIGCDGVCDSGLVEDGCGVCGGNNSTCTGCLDSTAENYDASATLDCGDCCEYVVPTESLAQILNKVQADATGIKVNVQDFLQPFAFSNNANYWNNLSSSSLPTLLQNYSDGVSGSNIGSGLDVAKFYGWRTTNILEGEYDENEDVKWNSQVVLPRVQYISANNLKIVCDRPQDNAVVHYNVKNESGEAILNNLIYNGSGVANLENTYSKIYATDANDYAIINKIKYYFTIDANLNFDSTRLDLLFGNVGDKIDRIKQITGPNKDVYVNLHSGHDQPWQLPTGLLTNFEKGEAETFTNSVGTEFPIYNIYEVTVSNASEFVIDLESIPGLLTPPPIYGCIDVSACNYNNDATHTDNSCTYANPGKYCDGTDIPVYGCLDSSAANYNPSANTLDPNAPCEYEGCTDSTATNYDVSATIDNGTCEYPLPCDGLPQSPICCQPGFKNASENFALVAGVRVATNECEVCSSEICKETVYICGDEDATNFFTGQYDPDSMIFSAAACTYAPDQPSNVHSSITISDIESLSDAQLESLQWIIYDTAGNVVSESRKIDRSAPQNIGLDLSDIINIETSQGCLWFTPVGYIENSIWDFVSFEIKYAGQVIHSLYGKNTPTVQNSNIYDKTKNFYSSLEDGSAVITQYGECTLGCDKNLDVLKTQYCETSINQNENSSLTTIFLTVTTSQINSDYSEAYVEIYDLSTGLEIVSIRGIENSKTYQDKFVLSSTTSLGIKASNAGGNSLSYKLTSENGELITTKTIK
jgi:hypothetical protein